MSTLVLVRHAEPVEAVRGRVYGTLDVGLSEVGRAAAGQLAGGLSGLGYEAVYSSPRRRAVETAAALGLPVNVDDALGEIDFGEIEGRTYDEVATQHPELYREWMETPTEVRFPGGESFTDLKARAVPALEAIRLRHKCAVVVTHGGVIRAALGTFLCIPDDAIFRIAQDHCGISAIEWIGSAPVVRLVNAPRTALPTAGRTPQSRT